MKLPTWPSWLRRKRRPVRIAMGQPIEIEVRAGEVRHRLILSEINSQYGGETVAIFTSAERWLEKARVR
jgi:hypothetical protein